MIDGISHGFEQYEDFITPAPVITSKRAIADLVERLMKRNVINEVGGQSLLLELR